MIKSFRVVAQAEGRANPVEIKPRAASGWISVDILMCEGSKEVLAFKVNGVVYQRGRGVEELILEVLRADGGRLAKITGRTR